MLAWIDLEMTGLDPARHTIIEIATLVTDDNLVVKEEGPDLVVHASPEQLAEMNEHVLAMHSRSGLLDAVKASTLTLGDAGAETLAFLKKHIPEPGTVPLAGNSIGTDRRFLAALLPEVEDYLHYRSVDVSTVKELCRRWRPEVAKKAPQKKGGHRALADIRESVSELEYYRTTLFGGTPTDGPEQSGPEQSGPEGTRQPGETEGAPDTLKATSSGATSRGATETGGTEERV